MRILFYFMLYILIVEGKISIKDAGVAKFTKGDIGMIFYITLCNLGTEKYHIITKMEKCCENITKGDMDCNLMTLIGGDYLFNRKGECLVTIKYRDDQNTTERMKTTITFNTIVKPTTNKSFLTKCVGNSEEPELCKTVDEDPFEECEPVDCHMKYLGKRNYFNYRTSRCEKLPTCVPNPPNQTPNTIYYPRSNKCHYLEAPITAKDLRQMEKTIQQPQYPACGVLVASANVRCHHGDTNNETGFCTCDYGWTSPPTDIDQYEPSLFNYHMCNIQISTWCSMHRNKIKITLFLIAICGAIFAIGIVMLSCCCHILYKLLYCKCNSKPSSSKQERSGSSIEIGATELAKPQTVPKSSSESGVTSSTVVSATPSKSLSEHTMSTSTERTLSSQPSNPPIPSIAVSEVSTVEKEILSLVINKNTGETTSKTGLTQDDSSEEEN